jgi:hypothetical protein
MKRTLLVLLTLLILASSGVASTLCASSPGGVGLDQYIANYQGFSNACQIGDKLFYNFGYSASSVPAGNDPPPADAKVIPDPGDGFSNPGLVFSVGGFVAFPGESLDATITYSVATLSGSNVMEDYDLIIAGSHTAQPSGQAFGSVIESFSNAPAGTPPCPGSPNSLCATIGPDGIAILNPHVSFVPWVNGTIVTTKIHLESPATSQLNPFDVVTISAIQEHFSEAVPEPYEAILIGSGLLFFGLFRKRVKYSSN